MRQIRFFVVFVLFGSVILALASCKNFLEVPSNESGPFWAFDVIEGTPYFCPSSLLATGEHCLVYGEDALNISPSFAKEVADKFEEDIYRKITGAFGHPSDLDGNGKVIILLLNIREENTGPGSGYTAGYFNPNDLFNSPQSNRAEMLYINYKSPEIPNGVSHYLNNLYTAMAHEFQHLINRSNHLSKPMDLWIDEGLSSAAEYLYGGRQDDRIAWFNDDELTLPSGKIPGTIRRGNNFFIWNGYWEGKLTQKPSNIDQLSNYATVYLFFQWLRIHAGNDNDNDGSAIYGEIINSPYTDYRAVTSAAKQRIPAFSGITDDDEVWAKILGDWYAANLLRAPDGIYGYKNEIDLDFTWSYPAGNHAVSLYPGEGVYSSISGSSNKSPTTGESTIRYLSLNASGKTVSGERPFASSTYLLTYNGSTVGATATEGYAADSVPVPAMRLRTMAAASDEISEPPEAMLKRWDGGRFFLEKMQESGTFPQN